MHECKGCGKGFERYCVFDKGITAAWVEDEAIGNGSVKIVNQVGHLMHLCRRCVVRVLEKAIAKARQEGVCETFVQV